MRIGLIAPPWVPVPPVSYGGTETVVDNLARGLSRLGHEVRLFTLGESTCPVARSYLFDQAPRVIGTSVEEAAHVFAAYDALADVDVIHDHTLLGPLLAAAAHPHHPPVVVTHHGVFTAENRRVFAQIARHAAVLAISHHQARHAGPVPVGAVIHHGIDLEQYRPGVADGEYLLFVGRMSADKGVHRAIRVARRSHRQLVILAKMREPSEHAYYAQHVQPLLDDDITVLIEPTPEARMDLQRGAAALINPITWPEPFGLVMAEALATATPVIAFGNGAAPEIIDHGRTGYLCRDEDAMVAAVARLDRIDRAACREAAERRFSQQRMATDHARFYRQLSEGVIAPTSQAIPKARNHAARGMDLETVRDLPRPRLRKQASR